MATTRKPKAQGEKATRLSKEQAADLRRRAEALAAQYNERLPNGDAGMIEAERRLNEFRPRETALYREFNIDFAIERDIIIPTIRAAQNRLIDFIEETPPETLVGAAAKLRRLCDADVGMVAGENDGELASLGQVLKFVESLLHEPAGDSAAFQIVCDMEMPIEGASVFAEGVSIFAADALDDQQLGGVLMRMGWVIKDHCRIVEDKRCELWRMLHPNRDHFEKEGWPGDEPREIAMEAQS